MFSSIIWATDGSEHADAALPFVEELARAFSAKVMVVHVDQHFAGRGGGFPVLADEPELQAKVKEQTARLIEGGIDAACRISTASIHQPGDVIADVARKIGADLIVVGSHGRGAVASALAGSVTTRLLHVAPCPVLGVPTRIAVAAEA
jgi:nucleotide-binding universal stress UspA family protein